jgi:fucose permease
MYLDVATMSPVFVRSPLRFGPIENLPCTLVIPMYRRHPSAMASARVKGPLLLGLAVLGFVSLGLPDGLLGVASPSIRAHFGIGPDALGPLFVTATAGYVTSSFAAGWLLVRMRLGTLLAASCAATAASLFGYASVPQWWMMVALGAIGGIGAGAIDAGINAYAAERHSARVVAWLHACYGIGASAGPALMTAVLMASAPWQHGYLLVGAAVLGLAAAFAATARHWPPPRPLDPSSLEPRPAAMSATLRLPAAWLAMAIFALYTGLESTAGAWAYSLYVESRGAGIDAAGSWVSLFWAGLACGRVASGLAVSRVPAAALLRLALAGVALACMIIWLDRNAAFGGIALALAGLAMGPVFPLLIASTPERFGPAHGANVVGFQIAAAAVGQSSLPALVGIAAAAHGLEVVGPILVAGAFALALLWLRSERGAQGKPAAVEPPGE